jgi:RNase P subunit RPR2
MTGKKGRAEPEAWDFDKATICFNCGKEAIQRIELRPDETIVTCLNCGAARHYRLSGVYIGATFGEDVASG